MESGLLERPRGRSIDPLYPEPAGDVRWIAERRLDWFGPARFRPERRPLRDLVLDGVLTPDAAALLALLVSRRASVLVIAASAGAGKSTLLESLLPWYPAGDRRIRLRGSFETFGWERDPRFTPGRTVLVAEEISGHLPTYLWGPGVGRFLGWRDHGAAVVSTAHGESPADIGRLLTGDPLRLPLVAMAAFDAIVHLGPSDSSSIPRFAVRTIWSVGTSPGGGLVPVALADDTGLRDGPIDDTLSRLDPRVSCLADDLAEVRRRIEQGPAPAT